MSVNIPSLYAQEFATNIELLLQIQGSKLRGTVMEGTHIGEQASPVDQVGAVAMLPVGARFAPMGRVDATVDRRWVFPSDFELPQMVDTFDKLRLLTDPESIYVKNAVLAAGRQIDDLIIAAFTADAKTGKSGSTTTTVVAGNEVDVDIGGISSALNVQKLLRVKKLARANFVDLENDPLYCALTAVDEEALLQEIQIISSDFNGAERPVLTDGRISRFLGINFVYCERLESEATGTNEVNVPVWAKSGMHLGIWNEIVTNVSQRLDISGLPFQSYVKMTMGATRIEESKIFNIESYRS